MSSSHCQPQTKHCLIPTTRCSPTFTYSQPCSTRLLPSRCCRSIWSDTYIRPLPLRLLPVQLDRFFNPMTSKNLREKSTERHQPDPDSLLSNPMYDSTNERTCNSTNVHTYLIVPIVCGLHSLGSAPHENCRN